MPYANYMQIFSRLAIGTFVRKWWSFSPSEEELNNWIVIGNHGNESFPDW